MPNFYRPINNVSTLVSVPYTPGSIYLSVADTTGFGSPTPQNPVRVSLFRGNYPLSILKVVGINGSSLAIASAIEGTVDVPLRVGDKVRVLMTAGAITDIQDAINNLQSTAGPRGYQGYQGPAGAAGVQGPQGFQGNSGVGTQGSQGPQGYQGNSGTGSQGPQGYQGNSGTGTQGSQGYQGVQGIQGGFQSDTVITGFSPNGVLFIGSDNKLSQSQKLTWNPTTSVFSTTGKIVASVDGNVSGSGLIAANTFSASQGRTESEHFGMGATSAPTGSQNTAIGAGADAGTNGTTPFSANTVVGANSISRHNSNTLVGAGLLATLGNNTLIGQSNSSSTFYASIVGNGCGASNDGIGGIGTGIFSNHPDSFGIGWGLDSSKAGEFFFGSRRVAAVAPSIKLVGSTTQFTTASHFSLETEWVDVVDATRKSRTMFSSYDWGGKREAIRIEADGSNARIGFYGSSAVPQSTGWNTNNSYTPLKTFDPATATTQDVARLLATLVDFLKSRGDIGS